MNLTPEQKLALAKFYGVAGTVGGVLGTYHGWRRTKSLGWTLAWGVAGSVAPFVTLPLSLAQGFGKRES